MTTFDWLTNTFNGTLKPPMRADLIIYIFNKLKQMINIYIAKKDKYPSSKRFETIFR